MLKDFNVLGCSLHNLSPFYTLFCRCILHVQYMQPPIQSYECWSLTRVSSNPKNRMTLDLHKIELLFWTKPVPHCNSPPKLYHPWTAQLSSHPNNVPWNWQTCSRSFWKGSRSRSFSDHLPKKKRSRIDQILFRSPPKKRN